MISFKCLFFYISTLGFFLLIFLIMFILQSHYWAYLVSVILLMLVIINHHIKWTTGWVNVFLWLLIIILVITVVNFGRVRNDVSFRGNLTSGVIRLITEYLVDDYQDNKNQKESYDWKSWGPPKGYTNNKVEVDNNINGYILKSNKFKHKHQIIYQIHGGGYLKGFSDIYNKSAVNYSKVSGNLPVFSIDYRVAPQHKYPTALNDVEKGYTWLINNGYQPKDIIIAGDSAGGGLSLALALMLKNNNRDTPKMLILSSPWTDLTASGQSYRENFHKDVVFGSRKKSLPENRYIDTPYAKKSQLKNQYVSPLYGNYNNMPPILIQTGQDEMLLSDSESIFDKAKKDNANTKLITYPGMFHTFYILTPWLPESHEAWSEIHKFILENN